jgi:hypothetical protein
MQDRVGVPGWKFRVDEQSVGVYCVVAVDGCGRRFESTGTDPDSLMREAVEFARKVSGGNPRQG